MKADSIFTSYDIIRHCIGSTHVQDTHLQELYLHLTTVGRLRDRDIVPELPSHAEHPTLP